MTVDEAARKHTSILLSWLRQGSPEADDDLNDANRAVIRAMKAQHGSAWLLDINKDTWVEWDGVEDPRNFCATHVLPAKFEYVAKAVTARHASPYTGARADAARVQAIQDNISDLGGQPLIWS
jgi:hypothetical protein